MAGLKLNSYMNANGTHMNSTLHSVNHPEDTCFCETLLSVPITHNKRGIGRTYQNPFSRQGETQPNSTLLIESQLHVQIEGKPLFWLHWKYIILCNTRFILFPKYLLI